MRSLFAFLSLAAWSVQAAAAPAAAPAKAWPREVQAAYDDLKAECRASGGKFITDRAAFAIETELTNDGKSDWVLEFAATRCSNAGYSAWCGTAGCMISILGSGPNGLREIFGDNVRGWSATDLGRGRKGLEIPIHGTACGGAGAEACVETLAWNGRKWDLVKRYRWTDADYAAEQRRQAAAGSPDMPPQHEARWQFGGSGAGAVAATTGHPEFAALGLRCQPGGGVYMTLVPKPGLSLPPAGRPLLVNFTGSEGGYDATQTLMQEPGKSDFSGTIDPGVEGLLIGADTGLDLIASAGGGDEWQELSYLSLAGSTAAIRSLRQQCDGAAGAESSAQAAGRKPLAPLGILPGYYVSESEPCAQPSFEALFYDGKRLGLVRGGGAPGSDEENFIGPLGKVERSGKALLLPEWGMEMSILSPTRIQLTIQDTEAPRRWCPAEQMPAKWRVR
ncbi:hypothetical protein [Sphingopyxis sp. GW247-27LB]|uniref:hypothetical protein n=1 Tax=Sphingopyxis sp. GW247-27LB TaxID=2012632 RepID=UPI000BA5533C|nr:hypothetical protein [Sphingopyxis sp. GW247-27LB]PAL22411.1 hypothetical protein CD928_09925 [Sphingopyxis sp. GW247-27LB]